MNFVALAVGRRVLSTHEEPAEDFLLTYNCRCCYYVLIAVPGETMNDSSEEPVHLVEDAGTGGRFLVYGTEKGLRLDIRYEGETLWMTQAQIAQLFGRDQSVVSRHIANILEEGELAEEGNMQKMHIAGSAKPVALHSLDMVISVGYRVSSTQATTFRRWATGILVQFARKGFVVDAPRLKQPQAMDRVAELREIIRDIRSDEANVYRELRRICSLCQDYEPASDVSQTFYKQTQAKLVYAVTAQTPAEIIAARANHAAENMGLVNWPGDTIRKADVRVSKNYLGQAEIKELNRLTTILLDVFEDQLDLGRLVVMRDAEAVLDKQLTGLGRNLLRSGGSMKASAARQLAEAEYERFVQARKAERLDEADRLIAELAREAGKLPKTPKR
jgi:hypothetical protein